MSLVELMVGVAIGLLIVAAATVLVSNQLTENRRLLLETQVQQDLRATADIITRDLRRAGSSNQQLPPIWMWTAPTTMPAMNERAAVDLTIPGEVVAYHYQRALGPAQDYGFSLSDYTIMSRTGTTVQALTDRNTLRVTSFTVTRRATIPTTQLACPNLCADGTQNCWPNAAVQEFDIAIEGTAASDSLVRRRISSTVRQRNEAVQFNVPPVAPATSNSVCPP